MTEGFHRIMLPIDFSTHCDRAADYASWFARMSKGTVHLVHVIVNPADAVYEPEEVPNWVMVDHAEKKAKEMIDAFAQKCLAADTPREIHIEHGDPYEKLIETAKHIQPDLIVMATHGRGGVAHLVIGSVAEKMVRHAQCPVFVVNRKAE